MFPVGTMVPGSKLRPPPTRPIGGQFVALQGAWDDLIEHVDDVTQREAFALREEVAMASFFCADDLPKNL